MKGRIVSWALLAGLLLVSWYADPAEAGRNPDVKVAVHAMAHRDLRSCSREFPEIYTCLDIVTTYAGCDQVDIFPVFFEVTECRGVEYGLTWPGSGSCIFTSCSDLSIGGIKQPGDGISQTWFSCRGGQAVVPGFGWIDVFGPGHACVVAHPHTWVISILDCADGLDEPMVNFCAGLCGESGDHPCWLWPSIGLEKVVYSAAGCVSVGDSGTYRITYENYYWAAVEDVVVIDYLPNGTEYVWASAGAIYDPGVHSVTWRIGTLPQSENGSVEVKVRLVNESSAGSALLNTCEIETTGFTVSAAWDTTRICFTSTAPTTWGKIKAIFR